MSLSRFFLSIAMVSVVSLVLCGGTPCWASLIMPAQAEFNFDEAVEGDGMAAAGSTSTQHDNYTDDFISNELPADSPANPLRRSALKGLASSGSSSSSSSSSAPTFGSGGLSLCGMATDPAVLAQGEQSVWFYADTWLNIPSAVQSRLFRPPQVA